MLEKLETLEARYEELSCELGDPLLVASPDKLRDTAKAHADLREVVEKYQQYKQILQQLMEARQIIEVESDEELLELARDEVGVLEARREECEQELKTFLIPTDPNDQKNAILEIRAGTGGDEATLFTQDLFRMYSRYADSKGWKVGVLSVHPSPVGGIKEIIASVEGKNVYSRLKYESGVHRVQRVPETETQGRVHTSAVTTAVLPEADEVEVGIDSKDLRIDTYCSSGPGGQSVNTTYSAVRITHLPTGEVATCQDEKSQIKNKSQAMKVLRSRLYEVALREQQDEIAETRRTMVGSGDRSEKIRTYNFPQNRVTDHRIGLTLHHLEGVLQGGLDQIIDALRTSEQAGAMENQQIA